MKFISWLVSHSERRIGVVMLFINLIGITIFLYADRHVPIEMRTPFYITGIYFGLVLFFWAFISFRAGLQKLRKKSMSKALAYWLLEYANTFSGKVKLNENDSEGVESTHEIYKKEDVLLILKKLGFEPDFKGLDDEMRRFSTIHKQN